MKIQIPFFIFLVSVALLFYYGAHKETAFALPAVAEWKAGDFSIEIKDWDNPLGIEGINNSGLKQETCTYKVESFNSTSGLWEITRTATTRTCATSIPITVGLKTGEGYKGTTDIVVLDVKH